MTGRGWQAERLSGATRVRPTDDERNPPAGAHLAKHVGGWRRRGRRWGEVGALWPVRSQCEPTTDAPRERAHSRTRESRTSSKSTSVLGENADICSPVAWSRTTPSYGCTSITSPIFSRDTSISSGSAPAGRVEGVWGREGVGCGRGGGGRRGGGNARAHARQRSAGGSGFGVAGRVRCAPASSIVLKKMGAILPPMHSPPDRLFGTYGMSSPMYHRTELVADLRDEPVPTTSPTYATGCPFAVHSAICAWASWMPSRGILSIASACSGMSGRDHASGAGERSSVFVSPDTRNTVAVIFSGTL